MRILYQYQVTISSKIRYDFFENDDFFVLNMELNLQTIPDYHLSYFQNESHIMRVIRKRI